MIGRRRAGAGRGGAFMRARWKARQSSRLTLHLGLPFRLTFAFQAGNSPVAIQA